MKASQNTHLIVQPRVVLTKIIEPKIVALDQYFREAGLVARVTSGLRDAYGQLAVVQRYVKKRGLDKLYPEAMACRNPTDKVGNQYVWQMAWSHLLNIGIIINPPLAAECLMDYIRGGRNRKGTIINQTPHVTGRCFDIGGAGGDDATIADELVVMQKVMREKKVKGLVNILPEHGNNAIHCDCV